MRLRGGGAHDEYDVGDESYFSARPQRANTTRDERRPADDRDESPLGIKPFHRTPTGLSVKQMKRADAFQVNLEGGLDICINVEVNAKDPAGITVPYRLLVPKLFYEYAGEDVPTKEARFKKLMSFRKKKAGQFPQPEPDEEELETPGSAGITR
jgi:hypothetical protein